MAKSRKQKEATLAELVDALSQTKSVVFADFKGLTVKDATDFRNKARKENVGVIVAKKTLMRLAFKNAGYEDVDPSSLEGALVMVTGLEDEVAPAKLVSDFSKDHEALKIVAGVLERKLVDANAIKALAKLPSKQELLAKLVGSINAPVNGLVNVLAGNLRGLVNVLNAVKDQKAAA
ncbi:MAG: 50S ribosomal protein L10 [Patescibacteria group bacterium]|nr:MAG: 50S ribosomal protein L10 [Patescibacteria group bacterium]